MADLILRGGRVIDAAGGRDETADIAFGAGKVAEIGRDLPGRGADIVDARGLLVVPGNLHGFRRHVIEPSSLRIIPYLNISFPGIFAFSAGVMVGECADLRLLDPRECVRVIKSNRDLIAGVKVRVGRNAGGSSGAAPLDIAVEVAEETGLPVMAHLDNPPPSRLEVLSRLRRGDILTHCFRPFPNAPVLADGRIREEGLEPRRAAGIFAIAPGGGPFGFPPPEALLSAGFRPAPTSG